MSKEKKKGISDNQEINLKYSVGNDISKEKFDACISVITTVQKVKVIASRSFDNNEKGFTAYLEWCKLKCKLALPVVHVMEATGVYYEKFAWFLHRSTEYLSVVLPNKSKKYLQCLGLKTKTDKIDAQGLARMGAEQNLAQWKAPDENIMNLRSITRQRESLQEIRTQFNNQLHALNASEFVNQELLEQHQVIIELLDKQIKETHQLITNLIAKDEQLKKKVEKITEIKGVGVLTVATIIAETNGFEYFTNHRQLVSYAGYDVIENQSGSHVGKTKISKKGNAHIRRILHLPAFSVVTNKEPVFTNLYERVYNKNKQKMKAYVAVQRKLLVLIYTLWKKDQKYDPQYSISGNDEPEVLFPQNLEDAKNKVGGKNPPTQDEHPCNESPEVPFPQSKNKKKNQNRVGI